MSNPVLTYRNLTDHFPWDVYGQMQPNQQLAFELIAQDSSLILEGPTGTGKTAIAYTYLATIADGAEGPVYYVVTNKTQVDQVARMHPDVFRVYGRGEYDCHYYDDEFRADEIPCLTLKECPHRVDVLAGQTKEEGATPCSYYQAKFLARQPQIVVCTAAFYLYNNLFRRDYVPAVGVVIDEAHQIADVFRSALYYEISDWNLKRSIRMLQSIGAAAEAEQVQDFLNKMIFVLKNKPQAKRELLKEDEIALLMDALGEIDDDALRSRISAAVQSGRIDPVKDRVALKQLEDLSYRLRRYINSLEYALPALGYRGALNYITYAYSNNGVEEDEAQQKRVNYKLIVQSYYVAPLVKKMLGENTLAMSATIGDPKIFGFESGIQLPFHSLPAAFPVENTLILMPTDTPNLSHKQKSRGEPAKTLRKLARMSRDFGNKGKRSLMIVISESERQKFLRVADEEGVDAISYNEDVSPREAVGRFKDGEGTVLVGTIANYGEGLDLPDEICPITFVLRPAYPNPTEPSAKFEERRFGSQVWAIWQWRVMIEALQVRGRNVRSVSDRGATIFVSQQFRKFVYAALPTWLKPAYRGGLSLDECRQAVLDLLGE